MTAYRYTCARIFARALTTCLAAWALSGCVDDSVEEEKVFVADSETHWMAACNDDSACGQSGLSCLCGRCTTVCDEAEGGAICAPLSAATCVDSGSMGAFCAGGDPMPLCVPGCVGDSECASLPGAFVCRDGICRDAAEALDCQGVCDCTDGTCRVEDASGTCQCPAPPTPTCAETCDCADGACRTDDGTGTCVCPDPPAPTCAETCDCAEGACRTDDGTGTCVCPDPPAPSCAESCTCEPEPGLSGCQVEAIGGAGCVCPGGRTYDQAGNCAVPFEVALDLAGGQAQWPGDSRVGGVDVQYGCALTTPDTGTEVVFVLDTADLPAGTLHLAVDSAEDHWLMASQEGTYCGSFEFVAGCTNDTAGGGLETLEIGLGGFGQDTWVVIGADGPGGEFVAEARFVPSVCGNGVWEPGETCDRADVPATCETYQWAGGGDLGCTASCDGYVDTGCAPWVRNETEPNVGVEYANEFFNPYVGEAAAGDRDWMKLEITAPTFVRAAIEPINGETAFPGFGQDTDIAVFFYDTDGDFLNGSTFSSSWSFDTPGTYFVAVEAFGPLPTFGYRLELQLDLL